MTGSHAHKRSDRRTTHPRPASRVPLFVRVCAVHGALDERRRVSGVAGCWILERADPAR
jgi:hypothetical protein